MIPGFKTRLMQELKFHLENRKEFEQIRDIKDIIQIPENCFPPNCMVWVGASLLSNLNNEIDRFLLTIDEYRDNGNQIPDRFG